MSKLLKLVCLVPMLFAALAGNAAAVEIVGAGASLPNVLYNKWGDNLGNNLHLNYYAVGSGNGVDMLLAGKVDFGASDRPLKPEELEKNNLVQFPAIIGAIVPVVNIDGVGPGMLKLDGETLARIFLGKITKWNDPAIASLNRDLKLPDANITTIHRADSSGSTFLFTNYLSKASMEWRNAMGEGNTVNWRTGTGGLGSGAILGYMGRLKNSITYVDFSQAVKGKLAHVALKNSEGQFVIPTVASIKRAADNAHWDKAPGFYEILTLQQGESWPITGASFVLMQKVQNNPEVARTVLKLFDWGFSNGVQTANQLNFVSIPTDTQQLIRAEWSRIKDGNGKALW